MAPSDILNIVRLTVLTPTRLAAAAPCTSLAASRTCARPSSRFASSVVWVNVLPSKTTSRKWLQNDFKKDLKKYLKSISNRSQTNSKKGPANNKTFILKLHFVIRAILKNNKENSNGKHTKSKKRKRWRIWNVFQKRFQRTTTYYKYIHVLQY